MGGEHAAGGRVHSRRLSSHSKVSLRQGFPPSKTHMEKGPAPSLPRRKEINLGKTERPRLAEVGSAPQGAIDSETGHYEVGKGPVVVILCTPQTTWRVLLSILDSPPGKTGWRNVHVGRQIGSASNAMNRPSALAPLFPPLPIPSSTHSFITPTLVYHTPLTPYLAMPTPTNPLKPSLLANFKALFRLASPTPPVRTSIVSRLNHLRVRLLLGPVPLGDA